MKVISFIVNFCVCFCVNVYGKSFKSYFSFNIFVQLKRMNKHKKN